ncbi:hypothetical protein RJT34_21548 [Clitoria ternatea]|uniref:START domain-containing protein n=1 Tax=Clitoria ternatea TaxID=43366 RepID=A0AAN9P6I1_CLITE
MLPLFCLAKLNITISLIVSSDTEVEKEERHFPDEPLIVRDGNRRLMQDIDCGGLCKSRCCMHSRPNLCQRACGTCCVRCKCVPPGTSGNRELCGTCHTDMTTHGYLKVNLSCMPVSFWECYFGRYCKQLSQEMWGIIDVSLEQFFPSATSNFLKRPSGCLISELPNGYSKFDNGFKINFCFHQTTTDVVIRLTMGVLTQVLCSYVTLPLYALVTQMGSTMRPTMFNDNVEVSRNDVRDHEDEGMQHATTDELPPSGLHPIRAQHEINIVFKFLNVFEKFDDLMLAATISEHPEIRSWESFWLSKLSPLSAQVVLFVTNITREGLACFMTFIRTSVSRLNDFLVCLLFSFVNTVPQLRYD